MHEKRFRNLFLATATLLLITFGVMFSPAAHAIPRTQYKAVALNAGGLDANAVQRTLDEQGAQGWVYVGIYGQVLIFKK